MDIFTTLIKEKCPDGVDCKHLWQVTEWDKNFNGVDKAKQPIVHSFTHVSSAVLKSLKEDEGDVKLLSTGLFDGFTKSEDLGVGINEGEVIALPSGGTAGVKYWNGKFVDSGNLLASGTKDVNLKYVYYCLLNKLNDIGQLYRGSGIKHPDMANILELTIPVPPLEVQQEIVKILDCFAELEIELKTELAKRKQQYDYYRESLLSQKNPALKDAQTKKVVELSSFRRGSFPQPYGKSEWYDGDGAMPFVQVADISDNMQLVLDTKRKISKIAQPKSVFAPKGSIIISLQGSIGRIAVTQYDAFIDRTVAIFTNISSEVNAKYFVYQLQRIFSIKEKNARGSTIKTITKEEFMDFPIPVPSKQEQDRIVSVLDKFNALTLDISNGLPGEIEARHKQYEYYRNKLLTFRERVV